MELSCPSREESQLAWIQLGVSLGPVRFISQGTKQQSSQTDEVLHQNSCGHGFSWDDSFHFLNDGSSRKQDFEYSIKKVYREKATTLGASPSERQVTYEVRKRQYG